MRVSHIANEECVPRILDQIDRFLRQHNRLCDSYRMLRDIQARVIAEANEAGQAVNLMFR